MPDYINNIISKHELRIGMESQAKQHNLQKERIGVVISDCQNKTIIVRVDRRSAHKRYGKIIIRSKKYYVHDEHDKAHIGDKVRIVETRPLSKLKRWRLMEILA